MSFFLFFIYFVTLYSFLSTTPKVLDENLSSLGVDGILFSEFNVPFPKKVVILNLRTEFY